MGNKVKYFGCYKTLDEALKIRDKLVENNWKTDWKARTYIKQKNKEKYIHLDRRKNTYYITRKGKYYGCYKTIDEAKKKKKELENNNWKTNWKPKKRNTNKRTKNEKNIHYNQKTKRYIVSKTKNNKEDIYGIYTTLTEAKKERDFFKANKWDWELICENTCEGKTNTGYKYIQLINNSYRIMKVIDNKSKYFGTYKTLQEAIYYRDKQIRYNWKLPYPKIYKKDKKMEHIVKNKTGYSIVKDNKYYNSFRKLEHAIAERDLLVKYNWDYEELCETE